uniref:Angiopoietin-related protein 2-like n=1 Tax=Phallusia mammillata TaxID=59560 RepID=A0A6F9D5T9_9ASCI|nr:angiopoietin-related protein 2-like [Phallusia mammillata]
MQLRRLLFTLCIVCGLLCKIKAANTTNNGAIKDPMIELEAFAAPRENTDTSRSIDFDVEALQSRSIVDSNEDLMSAASKKRDVHGNVVTISEGNRQSLHRFYVERGQLTETEGDSDSECTFTYVLPQNLPQASRVCIASHTRVRAVTSKTTNDNLREIYNQVMVAKSQMETMQNEIVRERNIPSREFAALKRDVNYLKQESRVGNERIAQLHTQLMHEIVHKRENRIEFGEMENQLLNHTIKYYMLRDQHGRLQQAHTALQDQVSSLEDQLASLRRTVEALTERSNVEDRNVASRREAETTPRTLQTGNSKEPNIVTPAVATPATPRRPSRAGSYRDCEEVQKRGFTESGIFALRLPSMARKMRVWCDLEQDPGGWIIIQRRTGAELSFQRNMASYKKGFGRLRGDFWLGLENIHKLTNQGRKNYKLHVDLEDWRGKKTFVEYRSFRVDNMESGYRLRIAHYSGNAGDSLTWHNNMAFTTKDVDNDPFDRNCATFHGGGWWYNTCAQSNLNGIYYKGGHYRSEYLDGIYWSDWRGGTYSLKSVSMKIRPTD